MTSDVYVYPYSTTFTRTLSAGIAKEIITAAVYRAQHPVPARPVPVVITISFDGYRAHYSIDGISDRTVKGNLTLVGSDESDGLLYAAASALMKLTPHVSRTKLKTLHAYLEAVSNAEMDPSSPIYRPGSRPCVLPGRLPIVLKTSHKAVIDALIYLRIKAQEQSWSKSGVIGKLFRRLPQFHIDWVLVEANEVALTRPNLSTGVGIPSTERTRVLDDQTLVWNSDVLPEPAEVALAGEASSSHGSLQSDAIAPTIESSHEPSSLGFQGQKPVSIRGVIFGS